MVIYTVKKVLNEHFILINFVFCSQNPIVCCFLLLLLVTDVFQDWRIVFTEGLCVLLYFVVKVNSDHEGTRHFGSNMLCNMEKTSPMYR